MTVSSITTKHPIQRIDIVIIIVIVAILIIIRGVLIETSAIVMFDYDAYGYASSAILAAKGISDFPSDPFVIFLVFIYQFAPDSDPLQVMRAINLISSIPLIVFFYLIARKIFNRFFSIASTLFASILPLYLMYSLTLHNDIFALFLGFASLYFAINPKRFYHLGISGGLIILAYMVRPDVFVIFSIPFAISLARCLNRTITNVKLIFLIIICITLLVSVTYLITAYTQDSDHPLGFNTSRILSSLSYETINKAWEDSTTLTKNESLDKLYLIFIFVGTIGFLYRYHSDIYKILKNRTAKFSEAQWTAIYLAISFVVSLASLAAYHIYYTETGQGFVMRITPRYLIANQLLMIYGFIHAFVFFFNSIFSSRSYIGN